MADKRQVEAISAARTEIAKRISPFCRSLPPDEFEKLLDQMAQIQWKYEVLSFRAEPPPQEDRRQLMT